MVRHAPPLPLIEAFLVAAGSTTFREAADDLALSASALSRRIQALESFIGGQLFDRTSRTVRLTPLGQRYRDAVSGPLEAIRRASMQINAQEPADRPLRIMASHSIATGWLASITAQLQQDVPEVQIELIIGRTEKEMRDSAADIAVLSGTQEVTEHPSRKLLDLHAVVLATPSEMKARRCLTLPEVTDGRRLAVRDPGGLWELWMSLLGRSDSFTRPAKHYDTLMLMYEASAGGLGLTLGTALHANRFLREGKLVRAMERAVRLPHFYMLAYPDEATRRQRTVCQISDWLHTQAGSSSREFEAA